VRGKKTGFTSEIGVPVSQIHSVFRVRVYERGMRIRTDGEYAHRKDTIESAASRLNCNKIRAVLVSCEVVSDVLDDVEDALEHLDLSPSLRDDLAEKMRTPRVDITVSEPELRCHWIIHLPLLRDTLMTWCPSLMRRN